MQACNPENRADKEFHVEVGDGMQRPGKMIELSVDDIKVVKRSQLHSKM